MSVLPNRRSNVSLDRDRRSRRSWVKRLEVGAMVVIVCAAGVLVYALLRTLCCGQ